MIYNITPPDQVGLLLIYSAGLKYYFHKIIRFSIKNKSCL